VWGVEEELKKALSVRNKNRVLQKLNFFNHFKKTNVCMPFSESMPMAIIKKGTTP
jgi:hypothetical protein